jgi:hypothetical protein
MTTYDQIKDEIKLELAGGDTLEDIKDRSYEIVESNLPIYNNHIIQEWQDMPNEYDNRGSAETGHNCQEIDIINLMRTDLYLYYQDLVALVLDDLEQEREGE